MYKLPIEIPSEIKGRGLEVEVTVFLPCDSEVWRNMPNFMGYMGCLEFMRFAVDPDSNTFYFGPIEEKIVNDIKQLHLTAD